MTADVAPVWVALSRVQAELPAIGKDDRNQQEGFNFRSSESINRVLSPLLAKHGVVIVPKSRVVDVKASPAMKEGWQDVYLTVDWTIYGPDGTNITARTNGVGRDKVDRGANKAATQAYKYLVLQLFGVADKDDDADGHSYEHERVETPPQPTFSAEAHELFRELSEASAAVKTAVKAYAEGKGRKVDLKALDDEAWRSDVRHAIYEAEHDTHADEIADAANNHGAVEQPELAAQQ